MKKALSILLAVLMLAFAFTGCTEKEPELPEGQVTTKGAVITGNDAIDYIRDTYTIEELGLENAPEDYKLMVNGNGVVYDGENYIKVVANVVAENEGVTSQDGKKTYTFIPYGEYLIAFNGKKVLKKDMTAEDVYTELPCSVNDYMAKGGSQVEVSDPHQHSEAE